jgi:hypothetical protein
MSNSTNGAGQRATTARLALLHLSLLLLQCCLPDLLVQRLLLLLLLRLFLVFLLLLLLCLLSCLVIQSPDMHQFQHRVQHHGVSR